MSAQMHLLSAFCQEQAGRAPLFNFITPFGMKLHLCFRLLRPDRENFMARVGGYSHTHTRPKPQNSMQIGMQFKCNASRICNRLD